MLVSRMKPLIAVSDESQVEDPAGDGPSGEVGRTSGGAAGSASGGEVGGASARPAGRPAGFSLSSRDIDEELRVRLRRKGFNWD
jgi:hypothetical protein